MAGPTTRHLDLTAVYRKVPEGYIGFIEKLPGANTQGRTLDEVRSNLREAAELILEANRDLARQNMDEADRDPRAASDRRRVKRRDLIGHLEQQGCRFLREGSSHTLYINPKQRKVTTIPNMARSTSTWRGKSVAT